MDVGRTAESMYPQLPAKPVLDSYRDRLSAQGLKDADVKSLGTFSRVYHFFTSLLSLLVVLPFYLVGVLLYGPTIAVAHYIVNRKKRTMLRNPLRV